VCGQKKANKSLFVLRTRHDTVKRYTKTYRLYRYEKTKNKKPKR